MTLFYDYQNRPKQLPKNVRVKRRISAYALIMRENRILMETPSHNPNTWELPGGGIEPTESVEEGVIRECYEETGYRIRLDSFDPYFMSETKFYHPREKKFYRSLNLIFLAHLRSKRQNKHVINTVIKNEVVCVDWVPISALQKNNCQHNMWPVIRRLQAQSRKA